MDDKSLVDEYLHPHKPMPDIGQASEQILEQLEGFKEHDPNYK